MLRVRDDAQGRSRSRASTVLVVFGLLPSTDVTSERLNLDTFSLKSRLARSLLATLQIEQSDLRQTRELVLAGTVGNANPGLLASNQLPVFVKPPRDIRRIKIPVADSLPGAVGHAEHRVRIATSKKRSVSIEREEHYTLTAGATGGGEPCPNQSPVSFASQPGRCATGDKHRG